MRIAHTVRMAAVAGAVATAAMASAVPASADAHGRCTAGYVCLFENRDYNQGSGDHWSNRVNNDGDFRNNNWKNAGGKDSGDGMDNETSSIRNRLGRCVTLYQNVGYTGAYSEFHSGSSYDDGHLTNNDIGDNRASAIKMTC